jgi:hypothetical protein
MCWLKEPTANIIMFVLCSSHLTSLGLDFSFSIHFGSRRNFMSQFRKYLASSSEWSTHSTKINQYKLIGGSLLILSILPLNRRSSVDRELDDLVGHMVKSNAVRSLPKFFSTSALGNPVFFERSTLVKYIMFIPWWAFCAMVALLWNSSE